MDTRVHEVLDNKGRHVITIQRTATVHQAAALMVVHRIGSVIVTDGDNVCGILSERDCVHRVVLEGRNPSKTRVYEVMNDDVETVTPDHQVEECMSIMSQHRCRHLPVHHDGRLVGLISIGDCVAHLCDTALTENAVLFSYIAGPYVA